MSTTLAYMGLSIVAQATPSGQADGAWQPVAQIVRPASATVLREIRLDADLPSAQDAEAAAIRAAKRFIRDTWHQG